MTELLKTLWDNYYEPPRETEKKQAIEDYHMKLVETLSAEDRKLVLHIIDLKDQIAEDLSIDSFMSGFQLAWKLATELNHREKLRPTQPVRVSVRLDEFYYQKHKGDQHEQKEHHHNGSGHAAGALIAGPTADAAVEYLKAVPSTLEFYLNGQEIEMEAYLIKGENYVRLRDIGQAVDFNVYWDGAVQINSDSPYTGEAPVETVQFPTDGSQYEPQAGDNILCDDGSIYTITDVSRWNNNMFSDGPLPDLPEPTCDWSSFPEVVLPEPEARRYQLEAGDYLFIRNLYETRRMQYTLMNLAGSHPDTSVNGRLKYGIKGTPSVQIKLTIDGDMPRQVFWPWRESELTNLFNSAPQGTYHIEVWDVFLNGKFLYTEYSISVK